MKLQSVLFLSIFNIKFRVYCSVDCIYLVWPYNHTGQLLLAHMTHFVGDILSAILIQRFKRFLNVHVVQLPTYPCPPDIIGLVLYLMIRATTAGCPSGITHLV